MELDAYPTELSKLAIENMISLFRYQSLHTVVTDNGTLPLEVQICTQECICKLNLGLQIIRYKEGEHPNKEKDVTKDKHNTDKLKLAAISAAAVKAKQHLAKQEEDQIRQLSRSLIEKQGVK